ncbi:MAG: archaellin/type IV pilin N-terminal domain-containing protein [Candidatus Hermodarchaeota archaeon]
MKKIVNYFRFVNKKRAISPVIAVILLIGLAVAAAAAIFLIVLPLIQPSTKLEIIDAYVLYDDDYTKNADKGEGYGIGTIVLANAGTGEVEITNISLYYSTDIADPDSWEPVTGATSTQSIAPDNPYIIDPITTDEDLTIGFPLPTENDDQTIFYKIVVETDGGDEIDTSEETETVSEDNMQLSKDRPDISFSDPQGLYDYLRRTESISPTTASDNSEIKNIIYEVSTDPGFSIINRSKAITDPGVANRHPWNWNTFNDGTEGLDNGTYYLRMTVYDYAGLSKSTYENPGDEIKIIIDNDYVSPNVLNFWVTSPYPATERAEVGEFISLTAEIIDGGTEEPGESEVELATLHYRLDGTTDLFAPEPMSRSGTSNNWTVNIDSSFVDSSALEKGIECYVSASDLDENNIDTSGNPKKITVEDNYEPDISHFRVNTGTAGSPIVIDATITDEDQVNQSTVMLYWRQTDDLGGTNTTWTTESPTISGDDYTWFIWGSQVTIHGIDYFINATDRFSGHVAYEGSETSPNHIIIPDTEVPIITHSPISSATHDIDLTVECVIWDNDPTFGNLTNPSGTVKLYYRNYVSGGPYTFNWVSMTKISGDSSISNNFERPSETYWSGIIPYGAIQDDDNPSRLDYYIEAEDDSGNTGIHGDPSYHIATVIPVGEPSIALVSGSVKTSGTQNQTVEFTIKNEAAPGTSASAKIARLSFTITSSSADFSTYRPLLNTTRFNASQVWTDSNGVDNKSWITFTSNFTVAEGKIATVKLTFENRTTGLAYKMFDLDFSITFEAYNPGDIGSNHTISFSTPSSILSQQRYMRSDFSLLTTQTSLFTERDSGNWVWFGSSITWGIRVFVGGSPISGTGLVATVDSSGISEEIWTTKDGYWNCPQTILQTTDTVTISVRAILGSTERTLADFTTEQLGAAELSAALWTVHYHIMWDMHNQGFRYKAHFRFGDMTYDSFINNFSYLPS